MRPLRATDVALDYAAVMESKELLRRWSQSDWPADDFSLADNLEDLERHEREHLAGQAFTFTVLDVTEIECLGCVYVRPLAGWLPREQVSEADLTGFPKPVRSVGEDPVVGFWVRPSRLADGLDRRLLAALVEWLGREWAFPRVLFRASAQDLRQVQILAEAGLRLRHVLSVPGRAAEYIYCRPGRFSETCQV